MVSFQRAVFLAAVAAATTLPTPAQAQDPGQPTDKPFTAMPGYTFGPFAVEPMIVRPTAIDVDAKDRVWVVTAGDYKSQKLNDTSQPKSRIFVLEDKNNDGTADDVKFFAQPGFAIESIAVADRKVFLTSSTGLYVLDDADDNLAADGAPTTGIAAAKRLLTGFGKRDPAQGARGITLGPDHKLWIAHGDGGLDVRGPDGSHITTDGSAIIRCEPDGSKLELVAVNFRDPYDVAVTSLGQAFVVDGEIDGSNAMRLCPIVEGGDYGWTGEPVAGAEPDLPNDEKRGTGYGTALSLPGVVKCTRLPNLGSPRGAFYFSGSGRFDATRRVVIGADPLGRRVGVYPLITSGSTNPSRDRGLLAAGTDADFHPQDVAVSSRGAIFVADSFGDPDGANPPRGRIMRLINSGEEFGKYDKAPPYTTGKVAGQAMYASMNRARQFAARGFLFGEREKMVPDLLKQIASRDTDPHHAQEHRVRVYWVLDRIGGPEARQALLERLDDPYDAPTIVRILRRRHAEPEIRAALLAKCDQLAKDFPTQYVDPELALELLSYLRFMPDDLAIARICELGQSDAGADPNVLEALQIAARGREVAIVERLRTMNYDRGPVTGDHPSWRSGVQLGSPVERRATLLSLFDPEFQIEALFEQLHRNRDPYGEKRQTAWHKLGRISKPEVVDRVIAEFEEDGAWQALAANCKPGGTWEPFIRLVDVQTGDRKVHERRMKLVDKVRNALKLQFRWREMLPLIAAANLTELQPELEQFARQASPHSGEGKLAQETLERWQSGGNGVGGDGGTQRQGQAATIEAAQKEALDSLPVTLATVAGQITIGLLAFGLVMWIRKRSPEKPASNAQSSA